MYMIDTINIISLKLVAVGRLKGDELSGEDKSSIGGNNATSTSGTLINKLAPAKVD